MPPAPDTSWYGWYRAGKGQRWVRLAEARSYEEAWNLLLDRLPREGRGGESLVLSAGRDPNHQPATRR